MQTDWLTYRSWTTYCLLYNSDTYCEKKRSYFFVYNSIFELNIEIKITVVRKYSTMLFSVTSFTCLLSISLCTIKSHSTMCVRKINNRANLILINISCSKYISKSIQNGLHTSNISWFSCQKCLGYLHYEGMGKFVYNPLLLNSQHTERAPTRLKLFKNFKFTQQICLTECYLPLKLEIASYNLAHHKIKLKTYLTFSYYSVKILCSE